MLSLQIEFESGLSERVLLSKEEPLSIGRHSTCNIVIEDENVETLHARISWVSDRFELVAASDHPLNIDGNEVSKSTLKPEMLIRIGNTDILVVDETEKYEEGSKEKEEKEEKPKSLDTGLKPISEDQL